LGHKVDCNGNAPDRPNPKTLTPETDNARPEYVRGHAGQPVVDHIKARALGGHPTDPNNLDIKAWEQNARKGSREGQLKQAKHNYVRQGLTPEQADEVLAGELEWIMNDTHARTNYDMGHIHSATDRE